MKNLKFPNVLVFGATGMLGRIVYKYLRIKNKNVYGTCRKRNNKELIYLNVRNGNISLGNIFEREKIDYVINCIGALQGSDGNKLNLLNVQLPKKILKASKKHSFKIIHISTDAVFAKDKVNANEKSIPDPDNHYGKTKLAGEINENSLNIRTSILGLDPNENKGLLEYAIKNREKSVGFTNQIWSGSTTLQLAKFIEWILLKNNFRRIYKKTKIIHFPPIGPTTKYEIIKTFSKLMGIKTVKEGKGEKLSRTLSTIYSKETKLKHYSNNLDKSLKELVEFEKNYAK